jgi:catechol 2,3-dioxygenase-like lactoylglutathione lyase family enzyme
MIQYRSVVLLCSDISVSKQFYQELFDLPVELDIGGLVTFACRMSSWDKKIALFLLYPDAEQVTNPDKPAQEIYFETDEIMEFADKILEKKIPVLHRIQLTPWNQQTIRFFDPDGNLIEVGESMEHVVKRMGNKGLSPEQIAEKTMMPVEFISSVLKTE